MMNDDDDDVEKTKFYSIFHTHKKSLNIKLCVRDCVCECEESREYEEISK